MTGGAAHKVDFLVVGAQKGGTTALYEYLRRHPQIGVAEKELHYFDDDTHFARGVGGDPEFYHRRFRRESLARVTGDFTPIYMYGPRCPERIHRYHPGMRLIVLLRDPALRAYSQWNMERLRGNESQCFRDALDAERQRLAGADDRAWREHSYVDRGRYAVQLRRILAYFPCSQLLVLRSDDLLRDPAAVLARVCDFLHIPRFAAVRPCIAHRLPYPAPLRGDDRRRIIDEVRDDLLALQTMTGWDCSGWLNVHDADESGNAWPALTRPAIAALR